MRLPFDSGRSDEDIAAAAINRLASNVSVPKNSISVKVENGWVTLTGAVDWWYQKEAVEQDVCPLQGARGISNQATITPRVDTANLSDNITHALHRSWLFEPHNVHMSGESGEVTLTETVNSSYERQTAASTAWSAPGVTNVENDLAVI